MPADELDPEQLARFRRYCQEYFNEEFRPGQGTEQILDALARHSTGGDWIDLGCGPSTLFWSLVLTGVRSVSCADISSEALQVLAEFVAGDQVPTCYRQVLAMYRRPPAHLAEMRRLIRHYYRFDVTRPWPPELAEAGFDLVTAFGIFGLSPSPAGYLGCFDHLRPHLRPGGRIIGGNWIRSQRLVELERHDNRYLTTGLAVEGIRRAGGEVLHCERVSIRGDPFYDAVIVWAAQV